MKALVLGDCHGQWSAMNRVIGLALHQHPDITHIFQLGDFGYAWPGQPPMSFSRRYFPDKEFEYINNEVSCHFIDGNHECFNSLIQDRGASQPGWVWQPRGSVLEIDGMRIMFFGGASSIDKSRRTPGVDWWPEESITQEQVKTTLASVDGNIDVLLSHDHPDSFSYSRDRYKSEFGISDRLALDIICNHYKPKLAIFGHHHHGAVGQEKNTAWICQPIVDNGAPPWYTILSSTGEVVRNWK